MANALLLFCITGLQQRCYDICRETWRPEKSFEKSGCFSTKDFWVTREMCVTWSWENRQHLTGLKDWGGRGMSQRWWISLSPPLFPILSWGIREAGREKKWVAYKMMTMTIRLDSNNSAAAKNGGFFQQITPPDWSVGRGGFTEVRKCPVARIWWW